MGNKMRENWPRWRCFVHLQLRSISTVLQRSDRITINGAMGTKDQGRNGTENPNLNFRHNLIKVGFGSNKYCISVYRRSKPKSKFPSLVLNRIRILQPLSDLDKIFPCWILIHILHRFEEDLACYTPSKAWSYAYINIDKGNYEKIWD